MKSRRSVKRPAASGEEAPNKGKAIEDFFENKQIPSKIEEKSFSSGIVVVFFVFTYLLIALEKTRTVIFTFCFV